MGERDLPPSYNAAMGLAQPTAPVMANEANIQASATNPGWNPNLVQNQPLVQQPQFVQQHFEAPPQTVVVINQQIVLGGQPVAMVCPYCHQQTITRIEYEPSFLTYAMCIVLCFLCWPCSLTPFCTTCTKDANHKCSKCNGYIGTFNRSGQNRN